MDLTFKNPWVLQEINITFSDFLDFSLTNQFFFSSRPLHTPVFSEISPKWFSAITFAIWLRLIFRGRVSAWFFGAHLLFFHARGRILEAGVRFWNPEVDILARGGFWSVFGVPEKIILRRNDFVRGR